MYFVNKYGKFCAWLKYESIQLKLIKPVSQMYCDNIPYLHIDAQSSEATLMGPHVAGCCYISTVNK